MDKIIFDLGVFALKVLLILNAGAALVLFVLMGIVPNMMGFIPVPEGLIEGGAFRQVMFCFLSGITFAMLAVAVTYCLAQATAAQADFVFRLTPLHFVALMVVPAVGSFAAFLLGAVFAALGMS